MRKCLVLLSLFLVVGMVAPELGAQVRRPRRRRRVLDDDLETKNVYELRGRLKSIQADGKALVMDIPNEDKTAVEVMAFKITGETKYLGLREGQGLGDLAPGHPLFVRYRSLNKSDYKGTALYVRVLPDKPVKSKKGSTQ